MKKTGLILALFFSLTGCKGQQLKVNQSRYDGASVKLYYRSSFDPAYPSTFKCITPVTLSPNLSEKVLDFDASVRHKKDIKYRGQTGGDISSLIKFYRLKIEKPAGESVKRFIYISEDRKICMDTDEDISEQADFEQGMPYLNYELNSGEIDTSFIGELKQIVDSSPLISGKDED